MSDDAMRKQPRKEYIKGLGSQADDLYRAWGRGMMDSTVSRIESAIETGGSLELNMTLWRKLKESREEVIENFVLYKRRKDEKYFNFSASQVRGLDFDLHEPTEEDIIDWLHAAKGLAMRIEQFHSHTMHKNPNPEWKEGRHAYEGDNRAPRSEKEQNWLVAEDRYTKMLKNKRNKKGKGKGKGKGKPHPPKKPTTPDTPAMMPEERKWAYAPAHPRTRAPLDAREPPRRYKADPYTRARAQPLVRTHSDATVPRFPTY